MSKLAKKLSGQAQPGLKLYKAGGRVHDDEVMDKIIVKKMMKPGALTGKKCGGKVGKKK